MLIDWFTVGAQTLNFLILVWLLKRFLYQPILDALDAREKGIARKLADASAQKAEAGRERDEFQHKNEEFDKQRAALLNEATTAAKAERLRLLDEARQAADALSVKRHVALKSEQESLSEEIGRQTRKEVFAIARKTLAELAGTTLEERMGELFTQRLQEFDGAAKTAFVKAVKASSDPVVVRSAFDPSAKRKTAIQKALEHMCSDEIEVNFETAPDLLSGIEVSANGLKIAWSIPDFLGTLEKNVTDLLKVQAQAQNRAGAAGKVKHEVKATPDAGSGHKPASGTKPARPEKPNE